MALLKPIGESVPAFDAKNGHIFKFISEGGTSQIIANKLTILINKTNEIVYDETVKTYRYEHKIAPNILKNGVVYKFHFVTYGVDQEESPASDDILFKCYSTPSLNILNIPVDGLLRSSNIILNIKYEQKENEYADIARVILLDDAGNELFKSGAISLAPPFDFKYEIKGLSNKTTYKLYALCSTVNRTVVKSPIYRITTQYLTPELSTLFELENICDEGYVKLKNNFIVVDSESNPKDLGTNPKYIYDSLINLTEKGTYLTYNQGFEVKDNFTLSLFTKGLQLGNITTLSSSFGTIKVNLITEKPYMSNVEKYCLELECYDNDSGILEPYFIYSNYVDNIDNNIIYIRRINNIFKINFVDLNKIFI